MECVGGLRRDEDAWNAEIEKAKQEREEAQRRIEELLDQLE